MSRSLRFVWTALQIAWSAIRKNPLRSGLTALGILIGVAAVTLVVALGQGATEAISGKIDSLGSNALIVRPRETARSGALAEERMPKLTERDAKVLAAESSAIVAAAPLLQGFSQLSWRDANVAAQMVGTTRDYFEVRAWKVSRGELWTESAETVGERVCVVGDTIRRELFGSEDPVGRTVRIGRHPFRVVGVLERKGQNPFGGDQDKVLVMPTATMRAKLVPTPPGQVHTIMVSASSARAADVAKEQATKILRQRHHLREGAENDFRIRTQEEFRKMQEQILGVLSMLLLSIAAVSLVVGGIGIMNIMLVSVAERTREIGIRLAIGARERDILVQFLVEAVVLALLGGMAGALVSLLAIRAIGDALEWPMGLSPRALGVALATSTAVGLLFGFLPARRAARLDPIDALRRE